MCIAQCAITVGGIQSSFSSRRYVKVLCGFSYKKKLGRQKEKMLSFQVGRFGMQRTILLSIFLSDVFYQPKRTVIFIYSGSLVQPTHV
jgi:hypothetical protein